MWGNFSIANSSTFTEAKGWADTSARMSRPGGEKRWLDGLYLDAPEEWDDPYCYFRW